ncbi:putative protein kinase domain-containing protein, partial [Phytophthora infestans]
NLAAEGLNLIVLRFLHMLDARSDQIMLNNDSVVGNICSGHTLAGKKNYSIYYEIDRLLRASPALKSYAAARYRYEQELKATVAVSTLTETSTLLYFEAQSAGTISMSAGTRRKTEAVLPCWFIPSYQVVLPQFIADGSFGVVYFGKWLGTDVVIKHRQQFRHEADLWLTLRHTSLLGACHEGWPFELASHDTLVSVLESKSALGLQRLHIHGIIHADLKGNNILVCENDLVKLAAVSDADEIGATGAVRWKASECFWPALHRRLLLIYILSAVTGRFPWGKKNPDSAVWAFVTRSSLPRRPDSFTDMEWMLVRSMCCFGPSHSINVGTAANGSWSCYIKIEQP